MFHWRRLYDAGQLESTASPVPRDLEAARMRLLPVVIDEGAEQQTPITAASSNADPGSSSPGLIELTLARGQVRIAGPVDAGTLRTVLRCLLV